MSNGEDKIPYDHVESGSKVVHCFAKVQDDNRDVRFYIKLPRSSRSTPQ